MRPTPLLAGLALLLTSFAWNGADAQAKETPVAPVPAPPQPPKPQLADEEKPTYEVVSCNDGDTCRLRGPGNVEIKVRLVGLDAPEAGKTRSRNKSKKLGQPMGTEAKDALNSLVKGRRVVLSSFGMDAFNRNLAVLFVDDVNVNLRLVRDGLAEVYKGKPPTGFDLEPYLQAEEEARKARKGIWSLENYQSPKDFRKRNK